MRFVYNDIGAMNSLVFSNYIVFCTINRRRLFAILSFSGRVSHQYSLNL